MAEKKKKSLIRLDRYLGEMSVGTRSQIREMAKKGRIQVNGQTVSASDLKIRPEEDVVLVDGQRIVYTETEYFMLNKPQGVVSATEDGRYPTVISLIRTAGRKDLFPVGRLDLDTEGLLLITNDGDLAHRLLAPSKHVDKVYFALVTGELPKDAGEQFKRGVILEDGTLTRPARLEYGSESEKRPEYPDAVPVRLTIHEGKFHQVKRMFEALGGKVVYLKRLSMGPLTLDPSLQPGESRPLTKEELSALFQTTGGRADAEA